MTIAAPDDHLFDMASVPTSLSLADRFLVPPFSVLNAREGWWSDRKRQWIDLGIQSEVGRDARTYDGGDGDVGQRMKAIANGQSVFDPVLTELAYRWYCPPGGLILDPFAGGSVRGVVAGYLGYRYNGIELRDEQVVANREQVAHILPGKAGGRVKYATGDSGHVLARVNYPPDARPDLVFSCPPYHDLEVYSDDPADLSNMPWPAFCDAYRTIIAQAVDKLAPHRFCFWVVGELRGGPHGYYRGLIPETIRAFEAAGAAYYNELILISPVGTLQVRAARPFLASRKLGRTHQTALIFVKGDPKIAAQRIGEVPLAMPIYDEEEPDA